MWRILLGEFIGDLREQKTRVLLTMFAITWGTIAVVLLLAFGEGLRQAIVKGLLNAGERIFMVYGGTTSQEFEGLPRGRRIRLSEEDLDLITRSIEEIDLVSPSYGRWGTTLEYGDNKTTTYMEGVYPAFEEMRRMYPRADSRFINQRDLDDRRRVLFLGNEIAEELFGAEDPVGQIVMLDDLPFVVIGVMQKKFQDSMNNGPDSRRAIIPASTFSAVYGNRYVNHLLLRPRNPARAEFVKQRLFTVLGARYKFDPDDERALPMWDFIEDEKMSNQIALGIEIFLGLVGMFTLLVAGVGVANIMYVVVRERTKEIGIKLAIGAKKRHIMNQFVFEALALTCVGGGVGLGFSTAVVLLVDSLPAEDGAAVYLANPKLSPPIALLCVVILIAIGLIAGVLPARRAAKVDPVESLRYE
ncbi:MAG: ABC transporter permease [Gemmatimonadetes bacterium]|uniref:ABC transporter permease n=1 Tax=Candidatus Kutchimonas denitrificans TaxID=3056748 RepID=A0AAE4ZBA7_9BACT|nr:ABC transporter permease [Gemmatimonadota bacterium]NIR76092.1 ABC transporter permease [Candidatus Kutchimonas denitrificans]NIS00471.1 ABC transporter permease [Gemmatimonadota bacterium]NIT66129.1 ABC transporter permease [Gemmatimonadota bacterium]NIU54207.1 FtsX-like permease family protein [Gemmatimonadota bacterium]